MTDTLKSLEKIIEIVHELRIKCPWDREQTIESLRHLTLEETYELADAIIKKDFQEIKTELGDLLLHIIFYSRIAEEQNQFTLKEVVDTLTDKMIRRHPHIYGEVSVDNATEVLKNWEKIKQNEGKKKKSVLAGVPDGMPSLVKAFRMQEKAAGVGFDWEDKDGAWEKLMEEVGEFTELSVHEVSKKTAEMGDIFFALVNYCRLSGINPDEALTLTNLKFKRRFQYIEHKAEEKNVSLTDMTLAEMEYFWQEAKKEE